MQRDYRLVRNCICGQIYDSSPVDFTSDVGTQFLPKPADGNSSQSSILRSWMAKALASGMDTLFPSRIEAQRAEYWHTLYSSAVSLVLSVIFGIYQSQHSYDILIYCLLCRDWVLFLYFAQKMIILLQAMLSVVLRGA